MASRDIVPHAEDGTRDGCHRIGGEMRGSETAGKTGVLHAHLYGECLALCHRHTCKQANEIAQGESADVVQYYYSLSQDVRL